MISKTVNFSSKTSYSQQTQNKNRKSQKVKRLTHLQPKQVLKLSFSKFIHSRISLTVKLCYKNNRNTDNNNLLKKNSEKCNLKKFCLAYTFYKLKIEFHLIYFLKKPTIFKHFSKFQLPNTSQISKENNFLSLNFYKNNKNLFACSKS